ncbi:MAG TPA: NTP transferase domain-containing protein [Candidatus Cloacimonadota bacterium]|nr:NTP transferase domain-containing protein [Candidatus Cloacimonadota bacterium]
MDSYELSEKLREKRMVSSVLLCAGKSNRMGSEKAFLPVGNESAITSILNKLCPLSDYVVVVTGKNFETIKQHLIASYLELFNVQIVINENAEKGMFTSIKKGLAQVGGDKPVLLQMIDQPFIPAEIYSELVNILDDEHRIFQPSVLIDGQRKAGHPLIFSPTFREFLLHQPDEVNLRELIRQQGNKRKFLEVNDLRILQNLNTKTDFANANENEEI